MSVRYILAPRALEHLLNIWHYVAAQSNTVTADRVESNILNRMDFLAGSPGVGHRREDLTGENVKFFRVYSYLIVYSPDTKPLEIISIIHGGRDVVQALRDRT
jgi:toxin ParE1/3/4